MMLVAPLLATSYNHVVSQPIAKFLYGGMLLKASYYGRNHTQFMLSRSTGDDDSVIWTVEFSLPSAQRVSRNSHGTPPEGQVDILSYEHAYGGYDEIWQRGYMKLGKIKGDAAQFQRDLIIMRMFIEGDNEIDHLKNE